MENNKLKISDLSDSLDLIRSTRSSLVKLEEDYKNNFLKKVEILYALFRKNSKSSENWNRQMSFNIGTGIDDISYELRSEIALSRNPDYLTYLCHIMVGCLVLKKELVCFLGEERRETVDILPVIEKTAEMLGLNVVFSTKDKIFRDEPYKIRCATFNTNNLNMYLTEEQISENSIVVIDHEDGKQTPYFISKKGIGTISKATLLIGWKLVDLISDPRPFVKKTNTERYYIGNKESKGNDKSVKGYRSLKNEERVDLVLKIRNINELHEILDVL